MLTPAPARRSREGERPHLDVVLPHLSGVEAPAHLVGLLVARRAHPERVLRVFPVRALLRGLRVGEAVEGGHGVRV